MKKATITFLLACVVAAGAFAQITFSGEAHAGIQFRNTPDADETITTTHREYGMPKFDFTATVMRENFGARFDTTFQQSGDEGFTVNGIYGWVNFPGFSDGDSLRLTMGQISNPAWVTRLHSSTPELFFDDITGFRLEYTTPVPGLTVGAAFRADGNDLQRSGERMIFGANYIHPMFNAVLAYDLSSNVRTLFGFNFTGIPDLTAGIQLQAIELASWGDDPVFHGELLTHQMVGYRITRPLFVYVIYGQRIFGSDQGMDWEITSGAEYRFLPNLTGSFSVTLDNFDGNPNKNLTLIPGLELTLSGPAIFYAEYELRLDDMDRATHTFGFGLTIRAF